MVCFFDNLIFLLAFTGSIGRIDSNFFLLASSTGSLIVSTDSFAISAIVVGFSYASSFCFAFVLDNSNVAVFLKIGDDSLIYPSRLSGVMERGPCFLGNSFGDHFGDRFRRGERRGECLGDDHGDLRGESRGDLKRDDSLRGEDNPGDLDLDRNRRGDTLLGDNLGDLDLGDLSGGEYLGDLDLDNRGVLERDTIGERGLGVFDRLGDLDLCGRGDLDRDESLGDLALGDNFLSGDLFIDTLFGDLRGESLGDLDLGEYRDNGGDILYLVDVSLGDFFNCLTGDLLGDLLGDFFRDRDLGDNDLRFWLTRFVTCGETDLLSFLTIVVRDEVITLFRSFLP